jgi:hypothetical protein
MLLDIDTPDTDVALHLSNVVARGNMNRPAVVVFVTGHFPAAGLR